MNLPLVTFDERLEALSTPGEHAGDQLRVVHPPALACEAAGRRSGGLVGLCLVGVLLVRLLVGLLLAAGVMMVVVMGVMVMHRRLRCQRRRTGEGGREGESAERGLSLDTFMWESPFFR